MAIRLLLILGLLIKSMAGIGLAPCATAIGARDVGMSCCAPAADETKSCCSPADAATASCCCSKRAPEAPKPAPTVRTQLGQLLFLLPVIGFAVAAPDETASLSRPGSVPQACRAGQAMRPLLCIWLT
jgi:hypothetical protein